MTNYGRSCEKYVYSPPFNKGLVPIDSQIFKWTIFKVESLKIDISKKLYLQFNM